MSIAVFDPEAIMRRVRAAAKASEPAKAASLLRSEDEVSTLAEIAWPPGSHDGDTSDLDALDLDAIEERAAFAESVPVANRDAWARPNCPKPASVFKMPEGGGVRVRLGASGNLKPSGAREALVRWLPELKARDSERRCFVCGQPARFGFGVHLRRGLEGRWTCAAHRPHGQGRA
jgi:hypothetical protein